MNRLVEFQKHLRVKPHIFILAQDFKQECFVEDRVGGRADELGGAAGLEKADADTEVLVFSLVHEVYESPALNDFQRQVALVGVNFAGQRARGLAIAEGAECSPFRVGETGGVGGAGGSVAHAAHGELLENISEDTFLFEFFDDSVAVEIGQLGVLGDGGAQVLEESVFLEVIFDEGLDLLHLGVARVRLGGAT